MKIIHFPVCIAVLVTAMSCSHSDPKPKRSEGSTQVQAEADPAKVEAQKKAISLTNGWPQSSTAAAAEMIRKHGEPIERTDNSLIWRNVPPFERIIVNKVVHSSRYPVLHQNAVDHVVTYKVPKDMVDEVRQFNADVIVDARKGEMTASGENENMNILTLNMAHEVAMGKLSPEEARIEFGNQSLNLLNGQKTAYTQSLNFGRQMNTSDKGKSMTEDIKWETKESQESEELKE